LKKVEVEAEFGQQSRTMRDKAGENGIGEMKVDWDWVEVLLTSPLVPLSIPYL
jgi:hypothetical protein